MSLIKFHDPVAKSIDPDYPMDDPMDDPMEVSKVDDDKVDDDDDKVDPFWSKCRLPSSFFDIEFQETLYSSIWSPNNYRSFYNLRLFYCNPFILDYYNQLLPSLPRNTLVKEGKPLHQLEKIGFQHLPVSFLYFPSFSKSRKYNDNRCYLQMYFFDPSHRLVNLKIFFHLEAFKKLFYLLQCGYFNRLCPDTLNLILRIYFEKFVLNYNFPVPSWTKPNTCFSVSYSVFKFTPYPPLTRTSVSNNASTNQNSIITSANTGNLRFRVLHSLFEEKEFPLIQNQESFNQGLNILFNYLFPKLFFISK